MPVAIQEVISWMNQAYGDLSEPSYQFVRALVEKAPHRDLLEALSGYFEVDDDTDVNDDVSFNYILRRSGQTWRLALSMVGPFALLVQDCGSDGTIVVDRAPADSDAARIIDEVRRRGFSFLDRQALRLKIGADSSAEATRDWSVYQALFTDSEVPPG